MIKDLIDILIEYIGEDIQLNFKIDLYENNLDALNLYYLASNISINEEFIEIYVIPRIYECNKVIWEILSGNTNISEQFLEKYINKVNWTLLSGNTNISEQFFENILIKLIGVGYQQIEI